MIEGARRHGIDVTTENYPYTAGKHLDRIDRFRSRLAGGSGITYKDLQWADDRRAPDRGNVREISQTRRHRRDSLDSRGRCAERARKSEHHVASDGMRITGPKVHPRGQGDLLARAWTLRSGRKGARSDDRAAKNDADARAAPRKTRAGVSRTKGASASAPTRTSRSLIAARVIDKATYERAAAIFGRHQYVLVNGTPVLKDGQLVEGVFAGESGARADFSLG